MRDDREAVVAENSSENGKKAKKQESGSVLLP